MVSATTIATANPKKIIENRNKDMDIEIEKGNEETHTHKDCFGIMIPIFYVLWICVFNLFLLYMLKIVVCECE
jgi:hypothetical protein